MGALVCRLVIFCARMRCILFLGLLGLSLSAVAADPPLVLTAEQWAVPRSGDSLRRMTAVAAAMRRLQAIPHGRLLIRYPGGDEGTLWATELRAWLVSLGLASARIELVPGSPDPDKIELQVRSAPGMSARTETRAVALSALPKTGSEARP